MRNKSYSLFLTEKMELMGNKVKIKYTIASQKIFLQQYLSVNSLKNNQILMSGDTFGR